MMKISVAIKILTQFLDEKGEDKLYVGRFDIGRGGMIPVEADDIEDWSDEGKSAVIVGGDYSSADL